MPCSICSSLHYLGSLAGVIKAVLFIPGHLHGQKGPHELPAWELINSAQVELPEIVFSLVES